ncbi:MAG: metalloregulator ArsR/SmtB family transcription factor [Planctomycetota bacterium]
MAEVLDLAFRALADRTRRGVVERLQQRPHRAGELATALDVTAPALTRHLRILKDCALVEEGGDDADGRVRVYRLRPEVFGRLRAWVDRIETMWAEQLASFAGHVERAGRRRRSARRA